MLCLANKTGIKARLGWRSRDNNILRFLDYHLKRKGHLHQGFQKAGKIEEYEIVSVYTFQQIDIENLFFLLTLFEETRGSPPQFVHRILDSNLFLPVLVPYWEAFVVSYESKKRLEDSIVNWIWFAVGIAWRRESVVSAPPSPSEQHRNAPSAFSPTHHGCWPEYVDFFSRIEFRGVRLSRRMWRISGRRTCSKEVRRVLGSCC